MSKIKFSFESSKEYSKETFEEIAKILIRRGFTKTEVREILESAYYAVAEEYGD